MKSDRPAYVWDYNLTADDFEKILAGENNFGRLDRDWAVTRLLEYAPYDEIVERIGFPALLEGWPRWRHKIRSVTRQRGFDWLVDWLPRNHPEKFL